MHRLPADSEFHSLCYLAWAVDREWKRDVNDVKRELGGLIATISEYEPVRLLTPPDQVDDAKRQSFGPNVEII
jgi:agmatine deiminase